MAWSTIHDYINDPAGFEAHHRQWQSQGRGAGMPNIVETGSMDIKTTEKVGIDELAALREVADVARAYLDRTLPRMVGYDLFAAGRLADALNAYSEALDGRTA